MKRAMGLGPGLPDPRQHPLGAVAPALRLESQPLRLDPPRELAVRARLRAPRLELELAELPPSRKLHLGLRLRALRLAGSFALATFRRSFGSCTCLGVYPFLQTSIVSSL